MLQEDKNDLSEETQNLRRAINSLNEELDAVNIYRQRADACTDENLKKVMLHNMNEELEHAAMLIEWIRQKSAVFDKELKQYLFSDEKDITQKEK